MSLAAVLLAWAVAAALAVLGLARSWRVLAAWLSGRHQGMADGDLADLFIFIPARRLTIVLLVSGAAVSLGLRATGVPWTVALPVSLLWVLGPRWVLGWLRRRRQFRLLAQLPDAVALLSGLLRAGHGLGQGLALLAARQRAPLGQELQLVVRQHRMGVPLDTALQEFSARVPEPDVALLVLAVRVSREIGGNLAESLQRLGEGIRSRVLLRERIDALTAQGKLQGWIIGLLPLFMMAALSVIDPGPMAWLFHSTAGWATLAVIAALELSGFVLIRRIVRIDL
jgi:tight adherence protein B